MTNPTIPKFSFECTNGSYYSIKPPLAWHDVPELAIVAGENGAGKTQLLQTLAYLLGPPRNIPNEFTAKVTFADHRYASEEVLHVRTEWGISATAPLEIGTITTHLKSVAEEVVGARNVSANDPHRKALVSRLQRELGMPDRTPSLEEALKATIREAGAFTLNAPGEVTTIASRFLHHHYRAQQFRLHGESRPAEAAVEAALGVAPWKNLNDLLSASGFPYRVTTPENLELLATYHMMLRDERSDLEVSPAALSSGEKALFSLFLMLFTSSEYGQLPKLLLLDEPDAHLHTAQIPGFFRALTEKLVGAHGCRVIMTTHRPDTLVLAPPSAVFEMRRHDDPRIRPCPNVSALLGSMTSSVLSILPGVRCVFVEDVDDVAFYRAVGEILVTLKRLPGTPRLSFMTPAIGKGPDRTSGGAGAVQYWVSKLTAELLGSIRGIIDGDGAPQVHAAVSRLARHSMENYLYDPLLVFTALADAGRAPELAGAPVVGAGQGHLVACATAAELQAVVDGMLAKLLRPAGADGRASQEVRLLRADGEIVVKYPPWSLQHRGHDLAHMMRAAFDNRLGNDDLIQAMRRIQTLPQDLLKLLEHVVR